VEPRADVMVRGRCAGLVDSRSVYTAVSPKPGYECQSVLSDGPRL